MKLIKSSAKDLSVFFEQLTPAEISAIFQPAVFFLAQNYINQVKLLQPKNKFWIFEVKGGQHYELRLELDKNQLLGTCTCANYHSGERCKHLAAVLLWVKANPVTKEVSLKIQTDNLISKFKSLLEKLSSTKNKDTRAFNIAFGLYESDIVNLAGAGKALLFVELWLDIVNIITLKNIFATLLSSFNSRKAEWREARTFIYITQEILRALPCALRIEAIERLISAQKDEPIFKDLYFSNIFDGDDEMAEIKAYTLKNMADANKKLPEAFFIARKNSFSLDEQISLMEQLIERDTKYYPKFIALLAKKPAEQRKYMRKYYLEYAPKSTNLEKLPPYIKKLKRIGLEEHIKPELDKFFETYEFSSPSDYSFIEANFPQYLQQFCDNSFSANPYLFYNSLLIQNLHAELKLYLTKVVSEDRVKEFSYFSDGKDTAEALWYKFYKRFDKFYPQEAFDFYRQELAKMMPPKYTTQTTFFLSMLESLYSIEPAYTVALIDVIISSYPKRTSLHKKLSHFIFLQDEANKKR